MGEGRRNELGRISLIAAICGFLVVELQPWLPLASVGLFGGLSLKGLFEAFFEASMVGGFADWFAVTALFKDPLGIKLPHTSILAKNKDSIADAIPRFLTGFVKSDALAAELGKIDFAARAAEALEAGGSREDLHAFLRSKAAELLASYGRGGPEGEAKAAALRRFVDELLGFAAERIDAPAELAGLLAWARKERFDERALEAIADYGRKEIGRSRGRLVAILTPIVKRNAGWRGLFIGPGTVEEFLEGIRDELAEIKADKTNDARRFVVASIAGYAERLSSGKGPERDSLAAGFREALADEGFRSGFSRFAAELLGRLGQDLSGPEGRFIPTLERIEDGIAARLRGDEEVRARFNSALASIVSSVVERGRIVEGAAGYVAGLLKATDERYFVGRIEDAVWDDLQYIRVNGAVVGGLVGLIIALVKAAAGG